MTVGVGDVRRLAALARLRLSGAEVRRLQGELSRILEHVERLDGADGLDGADEGVGPWAESPLEAGGADAQDVPDDAAERPDALELPVQAVAPRWDRGFFVVPPPRGVTPESA